MIEEIAQLFLFGFVMFHNIEDYTWHIVLRNCILM